MQHKITKIALPIPPKNMSAVGGTTRQPENFSYIHINKVWLHGPLAELLVDPKLTENNCAN